jgi:YggT family protein
MINIVIRLINIAIQLITLIIVLDAILSFFLSPFHPIRSTLDRIIEPLLRPIRRVVPPIQNIDFSPLILLVIIQILGSVIINLLRSFI